MTLLYAHGQRSGNGIVMREFRRRPAEVVEVSGDRLRAMLDVWPNRMQGDLLGYGCQSSDRSLIQAEKLPF